MGFDNLEEKIKIEAFKELIPIILTDRIPNFADTDGIYFPKITDEKNVNYFLWYIYIKSKANVKNINKQIRLFFPKGKSTDKYLRYDIKSSKKVSK